jgi:hypothetical protein
MHEEEAGESGGANPGLWDLSVLNQRLEAIKQRRGLSSDKALAHLLGFTAQYLSDVRRGGKPPSQRFKFMVLDQDERLWTRERLLLLLEEGVASLVLQGDAQRRQTATETGES